MTGTMRPATADEGDGRVAPPPSQTAPPGLTLARRAGPYDCPPAYPSVPLSIPPPFLPSGPLLRLRSLVVYFASSKENEVENVKLSGWRRECKVPEEATP